MAESRLKEARSKAEAGLLITGDTLFVGSCGRTDLPGSDPRDMFSSLARLSTMNPAVVVCPGHNYAEEPFSTIGAERAQNEMVKMGLSHFPEPPPVPPCAMCGTGQPCGPKGFRIGRRARIVKLTSEQGQVLNGQDCVVESYMEERERYAVRMIDASAVKVLKPENLEKPELAELQRSSPKRSGRPHSGPATAPERRERPGQGRRLSYTPPRRHPPEEDTVAGSGRGVSPDAVASDNARSPGTGEAMQDTSIQCNDQEKQPMLYVDVNVTPGQPPERIVLFQGQNISEVAAEFAAKHVLTPAMAQKLHSLLREVVLKQELQNHTTP
eukprot:g14161.t1